VIIEPYPDAFCVFSLGKGGAITGKIKQAIKHTIKLKTTLARLAQLLQPSLVFGILF